MSEKMSVSFMNYEELTEGSDGFLEVKTNINVGTIFYAILIEDNRPVRKRLPRGQIVASQTPDAGNVSEKQIKKGWLGETNGISKTALGKFEITAIVKRRKNNEIIIAANDITGKGN